jgi:DNA repair exonuclease SbcCD ATPase subunit
MTRTKTTLGDRVGELQDEIKRRDERIEELRQEIDELRDLVRRMEEHVEDADAVIERWKESFDMEQTASGNWTWKPFWEEHDKTIDAHNDLVRKWNKYLPVINGRTQPVGRPLGASEAQVRAVLKLHKAGRSLRWIAEELTLSFNTVRTIVAKKNGIDRTSRKHLERIDNRREVLRWMRQKRTGDALPRQAQRVVEEGRELLKEAKGPGKCA